MQDRSQGWRGLIVLIFAVVVLLAVCVRARTDTILPTSGEWSDQTILLASTKWPVPDCQTVRSYVAEHGIVVAMARALAAGYTPGQIKEVRRRCGV